MAPRTSLHPWSPGRAEPPASGPVAPRPLGDSYRLHADPAVTGYSLLMACTLCLGLTLLLFPPALRHEPLDQIALRFGYPGPTHYEREIRVRLTGETEISPAANRLLGNVRRVPDGVTGEGGRPSRAGVTRGPKGPGPSGLGGGGNDDVTSLAHLRGSLPTVQSDELVIVTLVKPDYPRVAIEQGVEGRVELLALVDTVGAVRDVEVIQSAGRVLDGAASMAVRRCRFQPYVRNGRVQPVYANFRFNFTLLER